MELKTSRFGTIEIEEQDIITFPEGLVGLSHLRQFVVIRHGDDSPFRWLQSVDDGNFALLILNPWYFRSDYEMILSDDDLERLHYSEDAVLITYVTVTIPPGKPHAMTANLLAPLVINATARCGRQVILEDERYHTRHPVLQELWRTAETAESAA